MPVTFVRRYHLLASSEPLTFRSHVVFHWLSLESITALQRLITIFLDPTEEDVHMWGRRLGLDPGDIHDVIIFERKCARLVHNTSHMINLVVSSSSSLQDARQRKPEHLTSCPRLGLSLEIIAVLQRLITVFPAPTQEDVGMWGRRLGLDPGFLIFEKKGRRLVQNIVILVTCLLWLFSSSTPGPQGGASVNSGFSVQQSADHSSMSSK